MLQSAWCVGMSPIHFLLQFIHLSSEVGHGTSQFIEDFVQQVALALIRVMFSAAAVSSHGNELRRLRVLRDVMQ